jgi:hypothetical protein
MRRFASLTLLALAALCFTPFTQAQRSSELNNPLPRHFPTQERFVKEFATSGAGGSLTYHNGAVMPTAFVIPIFWGPSWANGGADSTKATSITNYIAAYGQTGEFNVITQYYQTVGGVQKFISKSNLNGAGGAIFDTSTPPTNVTDAIVQQEVAKYATRSDVIYEVFLPRTSYSSNGTATSCGGPNLHYCAYHGNFGFGTLDVKYGSMPYPSCAGCQSAGFSDTQNFEHFVSHETREAVTDPDGTGWWDSRGNEADDKCAWSPTPFTDVATGTNADGTPFAYQYEWSNANRGCVKTR